MAQKANTVLFNDKDDVIKGFNYVDLVEAETHESQVNVPQHTTESGFVMDDKIRMPRVLNMQIRTTDFIKQEGEDVGQRANTAWQHMLALQRSNKLLTIRTSGELYENMAIVSISYTRNVDTGLSLLCNIFLREIIIADSENVLISASKIKKGSGAKSSKVNRGSVKLTSVTPEKKTILTNIIEALQ